MCDIQKCGCNTKGNPIICVTTSDLKEPEVTENITVNNTEDPQGYSNIDTILVGVNNISAYSEHLEFVVSPKILSGKDKHVILRLSQNFLDSLGSIGGGTEVANNLEGDYA